MELKKTFRFEASHVLPYHKGQCSNLHGHSWELTVCVAGPVDDETGFVQDFADIKQAVQSVVDELDHAHLGAWDTSKVEIRVSKYKLEESGGTKYVKWLPHFVSSGTEWSPTSENLIHEIGKQLVKYGLVWSKLSLSETCTSSCTLTWEEFNAR